MVTNEQLSTSVACQVAIMKNARVLLTENVVTLVASSSKLCAVAPPLERIDCVAQKEEKNVVT